MENRLAAIFVAINNEAIPRLRDSFRLGNRAGPKKHATQQSLIFGTRFMDAGDMLPGHDQAMGRSAGIDVAKGIELVVGIDGR
jgi:hypothetical protein